MGRTLLSVGWTGFLAILLIHIGVMILFGICWWILLPPGDRPSPWVFVWSRFVRDGGSEALPLSQVAGYVLGARAAILAGLAAPMAIASTVVDVTMELLAQLAYTALGVTLLSALRPKSGFTTPVLISLGGALVISILFIAAQQRGFGLLERLAHRLARRWAAVAAASAAAIQEAIGAIYRRRGGLLAGFPLHLICWMLSAVEPWLALRWMGAPLGFEAVLAIESLLYAVQKRRLCHTRCPRDPGRRLYPALRALRDRTGSGAVPLAPQARPRPVARRPGASGLAAHGDGPSLAAARDTRSRKPRGPLRPPARP